MTDNNETVVTHTHVHRNGRRHWIWGGRPWDAFKTFAIIFSFIMNIVLLIVLIIVGGLLLPILNDVAEPIVGGLNDSFVEMSDATIEQEITIDTTMPIAFTLPLDETTDVVLVDDVKLDVPAQFILPAGGGSINGTASLTLPKGVALPVAISMDVDVDQQIPVMLEVPVAIPLKDTQLGGPFFRLRSLFEPLNELVTSLPSSNAEFMARVRGEAPAPEPAAP